MSLSFGSLGALLFLSVILATTSRGESIYLSSLDVTKIRQGWGKPQADQAVTKKPISIGGKTFTNGVGTHAYSSIWIDLKGVCDSFSAKVGVDDSAAGPGSVVFKVLGDGKKLWQSPVLKTGEAPLSVNVSLRQVHQLVLIAEGAGDGTRYDHADWAEADITFNGAAPPIIDRPEEPAIILTPKPPLAPSINGPRVYGCRPANPFLYRIPTTGQRPVRFAADGLPDGLMLDRDRGIITGSIAKRGEYVVTLRALNEHGGDCRPLKIVCGDALALTPPMGWNDWYAHYSRITDAMMREAAECMSANGMADVGYQYVNIDDCWMNADASAKHNSDPARVGAFRDVAENILPNKFFPDMRALTDFIHARGLKAGIYTSPGTLTCGGFAGSYQHEAQDAKQFANWGFDFVKYDWCSYGAVAGKSPALAEMKKPYQLMGDLLAQQRRDMVFNLCQYGMGNVWEWGHEVHGHSWRTAGDLGFELDRTLAVAVRNALHREWQKPGAWNDPDYIQIGYIGNAHGGGMPAPCPFTPTEQYAFMSLWCLMSSPLFYSGDIAKLDEFTLNILCNPEVIGIDQDSLGQCARPIALGDDNFLFVKDLDDGSKAVGLCNGGEAAATIRAQWTELGISGKQVVRDLWRMRDIGAYSDHFETTVPRHGVFLCRVTPAP